MVRNQQLKLEQQGSLNNICNNDDRLDRPVSILSKFSLSSQASLLKLSFMKNTKTDDAAHIYNFAKSLISVISPTKICVAQ